VRRYAVILAAAALLQPSCDGTVDRTEDRQSQLCLEVQQAEAVALERMRFESPVDVVRVGFCWCPVASITLADANGEMEHFKLTWPGLSSHPFDEAVLHYQTESNEARALNDAELVDAALDRM